MRPSTAAAIKTLLRVDASVTPEERHAVLAAMSGERLAAADPTAELSVAEAADYLRMSRVTLWRWCSVGKVRSVRRGKKFYIPPDEVARLHEGAAA